MWEGLPIVPTTIGLLALSMLLSIMGITESAVVTISIFLFHLTSMALLLSDGVRAAVVPFKGEYN